MGVMIDYLTGGHAKIIAGYFEKWHREFNGDHQNVHEHVMKTMSVNFDRTNREKMNAFFLAAKECRNYAMLATIYVFVVSDEYQTMAHCIQVYHHDIAKFMLDKGLSPQLVHGQNKMNKPDVESILNLVALH